MFTGTLVLQKALSFFYFLFLTWKLEPDLLGIYIWTLSVTSLFSIWIDLGLTPLLIRESTRDPERSEHLLRSVIGLKTIFALVTLALLVFFLTVQSMDPVTMIVMAIASLVMVVDSFAMTFYAVLRARQNVRYESFGMLGFHILVLIVGVYLIGIARSPIMATSALAVGSLGALLYAWIIVRGRFRIRTSPIFESETARSLLRLLPAFAAAGIFVRIYNVADSILLKYYLDETAVGLYSVPAKVITALQVLIPGAFVASLYPAMSHYFQTSRVMLERIFERFVGYLLLFAAPIMAGLLVIIPYLLRGVWPAYAGSITAFYIMTLAIPFLFLTFASGYLLNACDRQRKNTVNRAVITVLNVALNLILIPVWGVAGAGVAFLVTSVVLFTLDFLSARAVIDFEWSWIKKIVVKSVGASGLMAVVIWWLTDQDRWRIFVGRILGTYRYTIPIITLILLGGLIYVGALFLLRTFSREELQLARQLFRRPSEKELPPPSF
ncbi:polysaccharide biosynthesis C-terminal domain-containing protein [Candidatus Uhrbacteria bacterium]|nr:polysaccharide biosynthesis C-terminal domain-containing protein [Candidatus Uhrbacteria bacterium]